MALPCPHEPVLPSAPAALAVRHGYAVHEVCPKDLRTSAFLLTDYYIILSNKNKGGDCLLSSPDATPQSACLQGLRRGARPIPLLYEVEQGDRARFC